MATMRRLLPVRVRVAQENWSSDAQLNSDAETEFSFTLLLVFTSYCIEDFEPVIRCNSLVMFLNVVEQSEGVTRSVSQFLF